MKEIIKSIVTALQTEVPELRYVGEDWGQLDFEPSPVQFPCALVDLDGFSFQQMGQRAQTGEGNVYIRVADINTRISANAPTRLQDQMYSYYDLLEKIHHAIHGLAGEGFQQLTQMSLKRVRRDGQTREYMLTFRTAFVVASNLKCSTTTIGGVGIKTV